MALYMLTFLLWLQIYLGGLLTFNMNGISVKYNFDGCMDNVVFNGVRMIRDTKNGYQGFSMVGVMPDPWNCKVRLETEHGKGPYKAEKTITNLNDWSVIFLTGRGDQWSLLLIQLLIFFFFCLWLSLSFYFFLFSNICQIFLKFRSHSVNIIPSMMNGLWI